MTIRDKLSEMPGEKQIAWLLRVFQTVMVAFLTAIMAAGGTIAWSALQRLDGVAVNQATLTAQFENFAATIVQQTAQVDRLYELHYALGDRLRVLELRQDWDQRQRERDRSHSEAQIERDRVRSEAQRSDVRREQERLRFEAQPDRDPPEPPE